MDRISAGLSTLAGALRDRMVRNSPRPVGRRAQQRGQVLPIFAIMTVVLLGGAALLTDVSWWWVNQQRMERAADAGALAGAIHLPGNQSLAFSRAMSEAAKNGYVHGRDGVTVTPSRDPGDPRKLIVNIDGPVRTHFAKVFCFDGGPCLSSVAVGASGAASFVLPVPMGSPQNYYGVGFLKDAVTTTTTERVTGDTNYNEVDNYFDVGGWSRAWNADDDDGSYATADGAEVRQRWYDFDLIGEIPDDPSTVITGIQVNVGDVRARGSGAGTNCRVDVEVSWDGGDGGQWSSVLQTDPISTTSSTQNRFVGDGEPISVWGAHAWTRDDFANDRFAVRLTWRDGVPGCGSGRNVQMDVLEARVEYAYDRVTTTTTIEETDVMAPDGSGPLAPHGFWGALQTQGAPNIQGDAYMTYYDTRTARTNDDNSPDGYYQYGIEMPGSATSGSVWLFDPGFCHVDSNKGTGEYYTFGGSNGSSSYNPVSTFYDLYDTRNTPYNTSDDLLMWSSGSDFRRLRLRDSVLDAQNPVSASLCDSLTWHNDWAEIPATLTGGHIYRLHTYSTDPNSSTDQLNSTGLNAFAIWAGSNSGTPRVYGLGAMEAYVRLPGGRSTEFYLAQIDAEHAGKTMVIKLWDPGDTGNLAANLQILRPTSTTYQTTTFSHSAVRNSYNASNCSNRQATNVTSVTTNTGGSSLYNGCWLTIEIPLPNTYSAPHPSSDSVTNEGGWWKIRYNMSGSQSSYSTDLTTWEVELRGNPVHLVLTD